MSKKHFDKINKEEENKNSKKKNDNLKPLLFTFLGTFIVFFFAFTVLLPIFAPQVNIPALTDEHSMNSVDSNDFKGRIDPRLKSIEEEEDAPPPRQKMEITGKTESQTANPQNQNDPDVVKITDENANKQEPKDAIPGEEDDYYYNIEKQMPSDTTKLAKPKLSSAKPVNTANIPPKPQLSGSQQSTAQSNTGSGVSKVVLGSYSNAMQARLVSDTLIEMDLNVSPFIKEKNGRYVLQVGSFSDSAKAEGLAQELRNKGFNASVVSE